MHNLSIKRVHVLIDTCAYCEKNNDRSANNDRSTNNQRNKPSGVYMYICSRIGAYNNNNMNNHISYLTCVKDFDDNC